MNDVKLGSWSPAGSPIGVEYSVAVIEEIRREVAEGFQRLSRGGIEVGGVLYGTRDLRTVRIEAVRPISCEHARGPAFLLSDKDRADLNEQLRRDRDDPQLEGLIPVGWFLSHTRTEITLGDSDLSIYGEFFAAPWQVTMVVRPGRAGTMRAGFFVREADGAVKSDSSYLEFNFPDRLAGVLDRSPERPPRERERRGPGLPRAEDGPAEIVPRDPGPRELVPLSLAEPQFLSRPAPRRRWWWLAVWVVLAASIAGVLGLRYGLPRPGVEPFSLAVAEHEGQLQIQWNHSAGPIKNAAGGSLEIIDGADARTLALTPEVLAGGNFTWARKTGDVEVRMTVEDGRGGKIQEASRFLGPPPVNAHADELTALQKRRDELEAEVARLRQENDAQAARIQQLERTLRILQSRAGLDQTK